MTETIVTYGQIAYETFHAARWPATAGDVPWTHPAVDKARPAWETTGAAVAATAIARLDQPAQLAAAMTENVKLRKQLAKVAAQLADALTPTAADFDHAAEIMRLRGVLERLASDLEAEIAHLRATGVTRGNRDRQELATRIREALDQAAAEPKPAPESAAVREAYVVRYFAETWAELITSLPDSYGCEMNCAEANAAADLYRAIGDEGTAQSIIAAHKEHDDDQDALSHQPADAAVIATAGTEHLAAQLAEES